MHVLNVLWGGGEHKGDPAIAIQPGANGSIFMTPVGSGTLPAFADDGEGAPIDANLYLEHAKPLGAPVEGSSSVLTVVIPVINPRPRAYYGNLFIYLSRPWQSPRAVTTNIIIMFPYK